MPTNKKTLSTYLTDEETAKLRSLARASGLSCSKVIKNLIVGGSVLSARTSQTWKDDQHFNVLCKMHADQARLGNLLKRALNAGPDIEAAQEIRQAITDVLKTQAAIQAAMRSYKAVLEGAGR